MNEAAREIYAHFARTGEPPDIRDPELLRELADRHIIALGDDGRIRMAHPFAAHRGGTRVDAQGRTWWGSCAWDGLGIVEALALADADVMSGDVTLRVRRGALVDPTPVFHVAVPAARWWDDIAFT